MVVRNEFLFIWEENSSHSCVIIAIATLMNARIFQIGDIEYIFTVEFLFGIDFERRCASALSGYIGLVCITISALVTRLAQIFALIQNSAFGDKRHH